MSDFVRVEYYVQEWNDYAYKVQILFQNLPNFYFSAIFHSNRLFFLGIPAKYSHSPLDLPSYLFLLLLPDLLETLQHLHLVGTELLAQLLAQLPEQPGGGGGGVEDVAGVGAGEAGGEGRGQRVRGVAVSVAPRLSEAGQHRQLARNHHCSWVTKNVKINMSILVDKDVKVLILLNKLYLFNLMIPLT